MPIETAAGVRQSAADRALEKAELLKQSAVTRIAPQIASDFPPRKGRDEAFVGEIDVVYLISDGLYGKGGLTSCHHSLP